MAGRVPPDPLFDPGDELRVAFDGEAVLERLRERVGVGGGDGAEEAVEFLVVHQPVAEGGIGLERGQQLALLGGREPAFGEEPGPELLGAVHRPPSAPRRRCWTHCRSASRSRRSVIRTALSFLPYFFAISAEVSRSA